MRAYLFSQETCVRKHTINVPSECPSIAKRPRKEVRDSLSANPPVAHFTRLAGTFIGELGVHIPKAADRHHREDFAARFTVNSPRIKQGCLMEEVDLLLPVCSYVLFFFVFLLLEI